MLRALASTALVLASLAPNGAYADDCMCFAMPDLGARVRLAQSIEVGPFFSSDGTMLTSRESARELDRIAMGAPSRGTPAGEILWCWSADDPRCAPSHPSPDDGSRALRTGPTAIVIDHDLRWPEQSDHSSARTSALLLGPADGVNARVERPPRA